MANSKTTDSRRKLLKSITVGSSAIVAGKSLPESWTRPIVDSVILPVHAQTTDDSGTSPPPSECTTVYYYGESTEATGESYDYGRFCVEVCGDAATVSAYMGGVKIDGTNTPKFLFTGQVTANSGVPGTLTVNPSSSGDNCLDRVGDNFLSSRQVTLTIDHAIGQGILGIQEGESHFANWAIGLVLQDGACPSIPALTDCEEADEE